MILELVSCLKFVFEIKRQVHFSKSQSQSTAKGLLISYIKAAGGRQILNVSISRNLNVEHRNIVKSKGGGGGGGGTKEGGRKGEVEGRGGCLGGRSKSWERDLFVGWQVNLPATCKCIAVTNLCRQSTCCHTDLQVNNKACCLIQSHYTGTRPTIPSTDPTTPGAWQSSHQKGIYKWPVRVRLELGEQRSILISPTLDICWLLNIPATC